MNYLYLHYMTDNLEKYKTSKLNELTITYNSNLLALRNILVVNIQFTCVKKYIGCKYSKNQ